jgi:hypothetical protein
LSPGKSAHEDIAEIINSDQGIQIVYLTLSVSDRVFFRQGIRQIKSQKGAIKMGNSMKDTRVARGMSQFFFIVLLLLICGVLSAQDQEHRIRNIVLVHGAWADGSGWKGVYNILVKDGYNVSIVQEPETSFKDDVVTTKRSRSTRWTVHPCRS